MLRFLFIFPPSLGGYGINEFTEQPSLGMAYLASSLEQGHFKAEVLDANLYNYSIANILDSVKGGNPDIVCLSLFAFNFQAGIALAGELKKLRPDIPIIAGGAQPSALGETSLEKCGAFDAVVIGEGEWTILEIAQRLKLGQEPFSGTAGVIFRQGSTIIKNSPRNRITDLDSLPFPAFHLYPALSRYRRRTVAHPAAPVLTSRGCPFGCIFCSKAVFGRQVYYRSSANVVAEIDYLVGRFKVKQLDVVDDNFLTDKPRAAEILELLSKRPYRLAINLQSGVSAKLVDSRILRLMKAAGVYRIAFGVESGNQAVLDRIKKEETLQDIARAVRLTKKAGIRADAFFMIGLPGESPKTMQDTIDFAKRIDPHTANFHMVIPFAGTELYKLIEHEGRFLRPTEDGIRSGYNYPQAFYELGDLKSGDIERYYRKAYRQFYFRPKKILGTIFSVRGIAELTWIVKTGFLVIRSLLKKRGQADRLNLLRPTYYALGWGDEELDLLTRLVYHPVSGLIYRRRYQMALALIPQSGRLLEIGCGYGLFLPSLAQKAKRVFASDIHAHFAKVREIMESERLTKIKFSRADLLHLPYKDSSFDTVVCLSVLEHITDIDKAISELQRVLKKGGAFIFGFPIKNRITRILFKLIGRDDRQIHPQNHASILAALKRYFEVLRQEVFPGGLLGGVGLYLAGKAISLKGRDVP